MDKVKCPICYTEVEGWNSSWGCQLFSSMMV